MNAEAGVVRIVSGHNGRAQPVFTVLVKRSYGLVHQQAAQRCEQDAEFRLTDAYYDNGEPDWSTVQYESELAPCKALTDVVVIGKAHAPEGQAVQQMLVGVALGEHRKLLQVTGDRACHYRADQPPVFSEPLPFTEMPIRYDRAYGGRDLVSDPQIPFYYPRNDMGRGVMLRNVKEAVQDCALPNIEDPEDLLTPERAVIGEPPRWQLQPLPQGFGWRQRTWFPRSALIGSHPPFLEPGTITAEERVGVLPADYASLARQNRLPPYEAHFNNGASLGLLFGDLRGDEEMHLLGLTPGQMLSFRLPGEMPRIGLDLGQGLKPLGTSLQTISIRPDELAMDLIWQASLSYPGYAWLPKMTRLHAEVH